MQEATPQPANLSFLKGGGEMGELTRNFDWSQTSIGTPDTWPQSLRTTLSTMLNSKFPMFLFWGPESICFYNDGYRPSLGNHGKHPAILGMPGEKAWLEIWDFIGPMITGILAGDEATWFEDQSLPIYRNGHMEDVCWTFSYSPVSDEAGSPAGVFVICTETTAKVYTLRKLQQTKQRLENIFEQVSAGIVQTDHTGRFTEVNDRFCQMLGYTCEELMQKTIQDLTHPEDMPRTAELLNACLQNGIHFFISKRYIRKDGTCIWVNNSVSLVTDLMGNKFITAVSIDDTIKKAQEREQQLQQQAVEASEARFRTLVEKALSPIFILKGGNMVLELANQPLFDVMQVSREALGKPFLEILPEMVDQPFIHWMRQVYHSGEPIREKEVPAHFNRKHDKVDTHYWNFGCQPYYEQDGTISGVMAQATEITEQVQARKKVERSEAHLELLSNTVPAMIFYLDAERRYRSYNKRFMEWFGLDATEAIGKTVPELIGEETYRKVMPHLAKAYAGQQEWYEMESPSKMWQARWLSIVYTPDKNEDGRVLGIIVHATDITQSKQTEMALRESEARFRSLVKEAPVATCLFVGREMKVEVANDTMLGYWGKDESIVGMTLEEAVPELKGQHFLGTLNHVFTTGETFEAKGSRAELKVNGVLGTYYFDFTYKPLLNASGSVYGIMNMAVDVTEAALAAQRIEESKRQLLSSFNDMPVGLALITGEALTFKMANPFYGQLAGKPPEQLIGKPLLEALPELKGQGFDDKVRAVMASGVPFMAREAPLEIYRDTQLKTIYIDYTYQPQRDTAGNIAGVLVVVIDVTEPIIAKQKIEEKVITRTKELAEANLLLEQNNRELEQFAYIASHDLQEPLRKVRTFTDMLKKHLGKVDDRSLNYLNKISSSSERMVNLIHDVLDFSQLSSQRQVFEKVDLGSLIENLIVDFELVIEQKSAVINYRRLPTLMANSLQMRQLFANLLANALKFTSETRAPVISISARRLSEKSRGAHKNLLPDSNYCIIDVEDNGIGISEEHADKIFGIFQRLHGKSAFAGTGIGLALCKKIVQNHHGEIWPTSRVGEGTTFHVILPGP